MKIVEIKKHLGVLEKKYGHKKLDAVGAFFMEPVGGRELFSALFWSRVWSTYSLYDPSYSNRESFGFFVDVGNGWTTVAPTLLWLWCITVQPATFISPRVLGMTLMLTCLFNRRFIYFVTLMNRDDWTGKVLSGVLRHVHLLPLVCLQSKIRRQELL